MSVVSMEQMLNDYSKGVQDYTKDGKCIQCGSCCTRFLALSNHEINTIRRYIERHGITQNKHAVNVYKDPLLDMTCPFLDDTKSDHKCTIYDVRPLLCRDFICKKDKKPSPQLYKDNRRAVDMVQLFFGNKDKEIKE